MAQQLGIAEKQYSRWEIDPAKRNIEEFENVAEVLDVTLNVLLGFDKQQFFEHCKQVYGNNNTYHESSERERKLADDRILHLQDEIKFLRGQLIDNARSS